MTRWIVKLATKSADLCLISGTPVVERKNPFHLKLPPDFNMHAAIHVLTQIHMSVCSIIHQII